MKSVKNYHLKLFSGTKLILDARPYRTTKAERVLRGEGQISIPTYLLLLPTKEITLRLLKPATKGRSRSPRLSLLPFIMIFIGFSGLVYFSAQNANELDSLEPTATFSVPTPKVIKKSEKPGLPRSVPTHIRVTAANIDAPISPVGQKADKTMEVPPLFENITGWYKLSPTPGEIGPSVIVGHVDTYKGPSVFYGLKDLKAGDIIEVTRADKKNVRFKVTALKQFSQSDFPTKEVYGNIDHAGLRLITCGGTFNQQTQRYSANTVVFASMITK